MEPSRRIVFLGACTPSVAARLSQFANLDQRLDALVLDSQTAWPGVNLSAAKFLPYVAERLSSADPVESLKELCGSDLYLACACSMRDANGLAAFDEHILQRVMPSVAKVNASAQFRDEVQALVREQLYVPRANGAMKISGYQGRGPLNAWARVVATTVAIKLVRRERRPSTDDDEGFARATVAAVQDLEFVRRRFREPFNVAFREAIGGLSTRDRNLFRMHLVDGVGLEQLAKMYAVHRATITRWISKARSDVLATMERLLADRLRLSRPEFESLVNELRSNLDISLSHFLSRDRSLQR